MPSQGGMMVEKSVVLSTTVFKDSWEYKHNVNKQSYIVRDVMPDKKKRQEDGGGTETEPEVLQELKKEQSNPFGFMQQQ